MYTATWKDILIAKSDKTILLEGHRYFPSESVHTEYLQQSRETKACPWKGLASYYHIVADTHRNENAAWCYKNPSVAAKRIKGYFAFQKGVEISKTFQQSPPRNLRHDEATGFFSERYFEEIAEKSIELANHSLKRISLAVLEIDRMAELSEIHGPEVEKAALKNLSVHLKKTVRNNDFVGRSGSGTFLIVFPTAGKDIIRKKLLDLQKELELSPLRFRSASITLSISFGIAEFGPEGQDYDNLVKNATIALESERKERFSGNGPII